MAHIQWNEAFNTGIEVIDFQHQKIVAMINDLHDSSANKTASTSHDVVRRMREYVTEHFSFEEELLWASDYPYTETHIQLHQRFLQRLDNMTQRHTAGEEITKELSAFLTQWMCHHFGHEDQDYVHDVQRIMKDICN